MVVIEARDLPEQAQTSGNSFFFTPTMQDGPIFMSSNNKALVYQSLMLQIQLASSRAVSTPLAAQGAFDFVCPLGFSAELVYFRDRQKEAVLDLRKTKRPALRMIWPMTDLGSAESLGERGFLVTTQAHEYTPCRA